ncbi:MAG TPA: hypothetical protein VN886_14290 [Acidimicrobiales bacterium]|nr:hypothetical protein [Acidimicrobiales bacterium]
MLADVFGGPDLLLMLIWLVVPLWALVDVLGRPVVAFYAAGSNKVAWAIVIVVATFLGVGWLLGGYYLIGVRRKVRAHMERLSR